MNNVLTWTYTFPTLKQARYCIYNENCKHELNIGSRNVFILYNFKIKLRQVETQNYIHLFYFYYINYIFSGIVCSTYNFKFERGGNYNLLKTWITSPFRNGIIFQHFVNNHPMHAMIQRLCIIYFVPFLELIEYTFFNLQWEYN
jgi:hypothetical protein